MLRAVKNRAGSKSPAHLGIAPRTAHFIVQAPDFARHLAERLEQAGIDVLLRVLLARAPDEVLSNRERHEMAAGPLFRQPPLCRAGMNFHGKSDVKL
jgi:hypothetical protein